MAQTDFPRRMWFRWLVALLLFGIAVALRLWLRAAPAWSGGDIVFLPAIALAAAIGGLIPSLFVLAMSVAVSALWIAPHALQGRGAVLDAIPYVAGSVCVIVIIDDDRRALRASRKLLRQQETLFRELQHRVANSLQFVAGMLDVARGRIKAMEDVDEVLRQAALRISLTGQLHRRLHDMSRYTTSLPALLQDVLADLFAGLPVEVRIDAGGIVLPPRQMTPLVLLVTEAATNAVKHAFRPGQRGLFEVSVQRHGRDMDLVIADNGPGLPAGAAQGRGLGMQIMRGLASQLGGELILSGVNGTRISVSFEAGDPAV